MKRGTIGHWKMALFAQRLGVPHYAAVGLIQSMWHAAAEYRPRGDVGAWSDAEFAFHLKWEGDPGELIVALTETGWIDSHPEHRLVIHDWHEHCEDSVRRRCHRMRTTWANTGQNVGWTLARDGHDGSDWKTDKHSINGAPKADAGAPKADIDGQSQTLARHGAPKAGHGAPTHTLAHTHTPAPALSLAHVSEESVYTREGIQPVPETGGPPPSDDVTLSPVQRWIANTLPGIGSAYPANRRTGGPDTVRAIADALDAIVGNPDRWPEAQVNPRGWLHERIKAFAASPVAQTQYCPSLKKWLAEEWWANEALWQVAEKPNGKATNPSTRRLTAEELIARNRKRSPA